MRRVAIAMLRAPVSVRTWREVGYAVTGTVLAVPTFALALRAALREAPKVILVGEMRDRETIEVALTAAETGHVVFSTLHTIDASKTVERIVGTFEAGDQQAVPS